MSYEFLPEPAPVILNLNSLDNAEEDDKSIISKNNVWESSNQIPNPAILYSWNTPEVPTIDDAAYLYLNSGNLFVSTKNTGAINLSSGTTEGGVTGPTSSINNCIAVFSGTSGSVINYHQDATIDLITGILKVPSININNVTTITSTTLGSSIVNSSLTSVGALISGSIVSGFGSINIGSNSLTCGTISSTNLTATTLGSSVVNSSLTKVSALNSGSIVSGFGSINIGSNTLVCGTITATNINAISLGSFVIDSSLTSVGALKTGSIVSGFGSINIGSNTLTCGIITSTNLTSTSLGSLVVSSSLTSVGNLASGSIVPGFGNINIGSNAITCGSFIMSSTTVGLRLPSMTTTQKNAITSLFGGSILYDSTLTSLSFYNGSNWLSLLATNTSGNIDIGSNSINCGSVDTLTYKINDTNVLTATTLGSSVVNSSLTSVGALVSGSIVSGFGSINIGSNSLTCGTISSTNLTATTLGNLVVNSSLTSVGALVSGSIVSGFGSINIGSNSLTCGTISSTNLTATTLGGLVVNSSLTSVGALSSGSIALGFGNINNGANSITTATLNLGTGGSIFDNSSNTLAIKSVNYSNPYQIYMSASSTIIEGNTATITSNQGSNGFLSISSSNYVFSSDNNFNFMNNTTSSIVASISSSGIISCAGFSMTSTSRALGLPVMTTTQKNAISSPAAGNVLYDSTLAQLSIYSGSAWSSVGSSNNTVVSINNTNSPYSLLTTTDILICTASSGAIAITLPTAVGNSGKIFRLLRTDTTLANAITINTTSSQTIGGLAAPIYMWTANESWQLVSDGSNWRIIDHIAITDWADASPVTIGATITAPTKPASQVTDVNSWRRNGAMLEVRMCYAKNTNTGVSPGNGHYLFSYPLGLTSTVAVTTGSNFYSAGTIGSANAAATGVNSGSFVVIPYSSTQYRLWGLDTNYGALYVDQGYYPINSAAVMAYTAVYAVPITNWNR